MLSKRYTLFSILGFQVSLDPSWMFLAVLVVWSLATGYFPARIAGSTPVLAWLLGAVGALGLFASILLHEVSHAWVARRFNLSIRGITLFIFGGVAEMSEDPKSARSEFFVAIAGPLLSYLLAALFYALSVIVTGVVAQAVLGYLAVINTVLATFNLVPAFPLDGGRVLRAALWGWTGNYSRATRISSGIGRAFGIVMILLGMIELVSGGTMAGLWYALIGLFIIAAASSSEIQMTLRTGLEHRTVEEVMTRDPVSIPSNTPISSVIEDYFYRYHHTAFPVTRNGAFIGCVRIEDIGEMPSDVRGWSTAGDALEARSHVTTIAPDRPAFDALKSMQEKQTSRLVVVDNGTLLGIVTMRDIVSYLRLRKELGNGRDAQPR